MKNYIFDLAGVIINLDIERDTKALNYIGLPDFEGCLKQPEISVPTLAYLNGLMLEQEYCDTIRPVCRQDVTDEEILWAMDDVLDTIPSSSKTRQWRHCRATHPLPCSEAEDSGAHPP